MTAPSDRVAPLQGTAYEEDPVSTAATTVLPLGGVELVALSDGYYLPSPGLVGNEHSRTLATEALAQLYGTVRMPIGCFLVRGERTVLIDTGIGPLNLRGEGKMVGGNLLPALKAIGMHPADVDIVALSHLHSDHSGTIGGMTDGQPVFPNAQVVIGTGDWDYFMGPEDKPIDPPPYVRHALEILDARGQVQLVEGDTDLTPHVGRIAAPGHTPGHSLYSVHGTDDRVLLLGDSMYCPQQLTNIDWEVTFDIDPVLARRTRESYQRDLELHGGGAIGCHFPQLRAARILSR